MTKKSPALLNICALVSLVIFGYLLFFTVYRQMITQNEGFFYVIVFGGILILAFILLSLMTKLLAFSRDSDASVGFLILEILFLLALSVLFVKMRISYESDLILEESDFYRAAESVILNGSPDYSSYEIMNSPVYYFMGILLHIIFPMAGDSQNVFIIVNTFLLLGCAFLAYGIVRRLSSRICSLFVFALVLFMPSTGFYIYTFDAQFLFAFLFLLALFLTVIPMTRKSGAASIVSAVFAGLVWGIVLCMEPVSILLILAVLFLGRTGDLKLYVSAIMIGIAIVVFFILAFIMSSAMEETITELLPSFFARFNPFDLSFAEVISRFNEKIDAHQRAISENWYVLFNADGEGYTQMSIRWIQLGSQILYMFMLILSIACSFYMIRSKHPRIMPVLSAVIAGFFTIFLSSAQEHNYPFYLILILMTAGISLQYMYENHHALADENLHKILGDEEEGKPVKQEEETETEEERAAFIARAQALIFVGMNEEYYKQIKLSEARQAAQNAAERPARPVKTEAPAEAAEVSKSEDTLKPADTAKAAPASKDAKPSDTTKTAGTDKEDKTERFADDFDDLNEDFDKPEPEAAAKDQKKEVEYLENPLPVPRKHEHKDLDFDRVNEKDDDLDFDFPDDSDDDLDFDNDYDV